MYYKGKIMSILGFELHNGWIVVVFIAIISFVPMMFAGEAGKRLVNFSFASTRGKILSVIISGLYIIWLLYPFFLKIMVRTPQFYIGMVLLVTGAVFSIISYLNYFSTPLDQPIEKGMYRISRNPIYVFMTVMLMGEALVLHSWLIGITIVLCFIMQHFIILEEEVYCEKTYGESYLQFKARVPRYLFF